MSIFHLRVRLSHWDSDAWRKMWEKLEKTNWGTTKTNMNCDFFVEMFRVSKNWNYHVWNFPWEVLYINCFFAMTTSLMVNGWYLQQQLWPKTRSISTWSWGEVQTFWGWKAGRQFAGKKEGVYVEIWVSIAIYSLTLAIKTSPKSLHPGHWSVGPKNCHSTHSRSTLTPPRSAKCSKHLTLCRQDLGDGPGVQRLHGVAGESVVPVPSVLLF